MALIDAGFPVDVVSAAGTSTLAEALVDPVITEVQAGVYALMEPERLEPDLPFRCAVAIRGTVISRHPGRIVLDIGRRAVGMEYGAPVPIGFVATHIAISDEHATIEMADPLPAAGKPARPRTRPDQDDLQPARPRLGQSGTAGSSIAGRSAPAAVPSSRSDTTRRHGEKA